MNAAQNFINDYRTEEGSMRIAPFCTYAVEVKTELLIYKWLFKDGSELILSSGVAYAIA